MSVSPIESGGGMSSAYVTGATTAAASSTSSTGSSATSGAKLDKETFLSLLVAQLKYQDPMNPTDSAQFLAQTAQFTSLEKMQDVADLTTKSLSAQLAFGSSAMVGRTVTYTAADKSTGTGVVRSVTFGSEGPMLDVDGTKIRLDDVRSVVEPSTTKAAS